MIFPSIIEEPLVNIHPYSQESLGQMGGAFTSLNSAFGGAALWPSPNLAIFIPFVVTKTIVAKMMFCFVTTASGNIDVGIYDIGGNRLVSMGSTAAAGAAQAVQAFDITDTQLGTGVYYLAMAADNTTLSIVRAWTGVSFLYDKILGMAQMATAFPLPATATFATCTNDFIPIVGLSTRSVV